MSKTNKLTHLVTLGPPKNQQNQYSKLAEKNVVTCRNVPQMLVSPAWVEWQPLPVHRSTHSTDLAFTNGLVNWDLFNYPQKGMENTWK